ncbi:MAG: relaxase/mobilization nuclease domain-containing protein [Lachnospiraceae bacterium]|nr:relaxase/mobilization nuclease domain-containing protein [Lachnospiraceae bacterium]
MAILKHISVKNRFYSDAVEYLTCQFDEYTNKPVLDEKGRIMERENYLIAGVNCDVDTFGAECIQTNRLYGKNNSVEDVKAHHYIISFDPEDDITMEQAMEFGKKWLAEFAPGHQAVVAVHPDGHNNSQNMHVHMVFNSVRKEPGRESIWHDKACEWKQGCKHKSTGKMMYHAKKWVMDKCIRLGLGQVDLLAKKHKDNYWVEKCLMDKNALDGVGVTSDRELIRNTIDKLLPVMNSFEQLVESLRAIYHWQIRVTNKTVTFAMPDMKKGIRGNKLGEGYGKAELEERIKEFIAEREAKELAIKQMEAELESLRLAEQEKKRKQAEEMKKPETEKRSRVNKRNSLQIKLYSEEVERPVMNREYLEYLDTQYIHDWRIATEDMLSAPIMTREEFEAMQDKQVEEEKPVSLYTAESYVEEPVIEESANSDFYETDAVHQEEKGEEPIVPTIIKEEEPEQIDYTKLSLEERARILPVPASDMEAEFKAFKERMGYVGAKLASIRYKMAIYDEFREEYDYRKRYHKVEKVRTVDRSRDRGAR